MPWCACNHPAGLVVATGFCIVDDGGRRAQVPVCTMHRVDVGGTLQMPGADGETRDYPVLEVRTVEEGCC
jgi:hypothetical protein